jgi:hypothetical protein
MSNPGLFNSFKDAKLRFYLFRHGFRLGYRLRQQVLGLRPAGNLLRGVRAAVAPQRRILFLPATPVSSHVIFKLCRMAGIGITSDPTKRFDLAWHFDSNELAPGWQDDAVPPGMSVVNRFLRDVRKQTVERIFETVFGYPLAVDPTSYEGLVICKSNRNGKHDGQVLRCPIPASEVKPDYAYQRLIDNSVGPEGFLDLRVPVHGGSRIPLVYRKVRPAGARFTSYVSTDVVDADDVFTAEEQGNIYRFAAELGLVFGEMDVLRDNRDGRIYIVDVNNTPYGPPHHMDPETEAEVFRRQLKSLEMLIEDCVDPGLEPARPGARSLAPR